LFRRLVLSHGDAVDDIGVIEQSDALGFPEKALDVRVPGQVVGQDLDGDMASLFFVKAEVDGAHAALAQPPQDAEFTQAAKRWLRSRLPPSSWRSRPIE